MELILLGTFGPVRDVIVETSSGMTITQGLTLAGILLAAIGLFFTWSQLRAAQQTRFGDFLLRLTDEFTPHAPIHRRLVLDGEWSHGQGPKDDDERVALHAYMGLFERIWLLVKKGILELDTVDSMYGYRVYTLIRNRSIREDILLDAPDSWRDFIALWRALWELPKGVLRSKDDTPAPPPRA